MERYDIKIDTASTLNDTYVQLSELELNDNCTILSGVCDADAFVTINGKCSVSTNAIDFVNANCESSIVKRMGYITIDDVVYYVEDGKVNYSGSAFTANYIKNNKGNKFESMYVIIDKVQYDITDGQANQWYNIQRIAIENAHPEILDVSDCTSLGFKEYVRIEDIPYFVRNDTDGNPYIIYNYSQIYITKDYSNEPTAYIEDSDNNLHGAFALASMEVETHDGDRALLDVTNYIGDVNEGDVISIKSNESGLSKFYVDFDSYDYPVVNYFGILYRVSADMFVNVLIDGTEYAVTLDNQLYPDTIAGHLTEHPEVYVSAITSNGVITEMYKRTLVHNGRDAYFSNEIVEFNSYSGIVVSDCKHQVLHDENYIGSSISQRFYVNLSSNFKGLFTVINANDGNDTLTIGPMTNDDMNASIQDAVYEGVIGWIADNYRDLSFTLYRVLFGYKVNDDYTYRNVFFNKGVFLKQLKNTISISVPMSNSMSINLNQDQMRQDLLEERMWANVNSDTDIERDIYTPVYYKYQKNADGSISTDSDGIAIIDEILAMNKIQFNLHFRTRNLDDWSVIEDNVELQNDGKSSWNCLDHYYNNIDIDSYGRITYSNEQRKLHADDIVNHADLLYFLNFTNQDVFYQKSALAKTFIRLSFFDSPKPNEQSLLWTSTVFFDEGECFSKYRNNIENETYKFFYDLSAKDNYKVGVEKEPVDTLNKLTFDSDKRLCMEFPIENKTKTRVSSEGYYLYIYKDYAQYLHERKIYMRVDFNHAKIGQSVPMMMLHHFDSDGNEMKYQANCSDDVFKMRDGVKMENMLNYMYIPIKIVYNENLGKYTYHFENVVPAENESDILNINLFEVKYMDESK